MERLLRLAAAFNYEDVQTKTSADDSFKMTALLSVIKPTTLKVLIISLGYHTCYLVLRLVFRKDRPLAINAYYGFDTFNSPIYEMVNLSQVRLQTQSSLPIYTLTVICFAFLFCFWDIDWEMQVVRCRN
jgi:hypothetical protein